MAALHEPGIGPSWSARAVLPGLASVLDPADLLGAKNHLIDRTHKQALARALGDVTGLHVLDFGCGTGRLTDWLAKRGADVEGVDPSSEMIVAARTHYPSRLFTTSSIPLPAGDESYDVVVTALVLQYPIIDRVAFDLLASELARVLRRNGRLIAIEQVHEGSLPWGAAAATYSQAFNAAGLTSLDPVPVRWGSSKLVHLAERHPRVARLPLVPSLVIREARRAPVHPIGIDYVDTLFQAEARR